jgi:limonene-1,2-epoxide hydrolase
MIENEQIITEFIDAFCRFDADELIEYFTPDATYHNIPLPILRGRDEILASLKGLPTRFKELKVEMLHQIAADNIVMNERIDYFTFHDGRQVALPIAGIFEMEDGKIKNWREYFDLGTFRN